MFAKIIGFSLVYILTTINFFVFLSPLTFLVLGRTFVNAGDVDVYIRSLFFLSLASINFLMLLFLLFDFLFGYSVNKIVKGCKYYKKAEDYKFLIPVFEDIKNKFGINNVDLYISPSAEVNAYAVGSLRKKAIILTEGLMLKYLNEKEDLFVTSMKGILSHEMSHIVNNDYFTALLLIVNERAVNLVSNIVLFVFNILINIVSIIPIIGSYIALSITMAYKVFSFIIYFSYKNIVKPIYHFIQLQISKSIEYRADRQAGMIIGGQAMSETLSVLGGSGYFSIFSSHPLTKDRMKSVENVQTRQKVRAVLFSKILPFISFVVILYLCYYSYKTANVDDLVRDFNSMIIYFNNKIMVIKSLITNFVNN